MDDDGPDPELDPEVEQQVRALLARVPDPGPMPHEVSERISAALTGAARLRDDRAPFAPVPVRHDSSGGTVGGSSSDTGGGPGGATVLALPSRANRPKPLYIAAAVAAAAAVVAVGASALHVTKRPNGAAVVGGPYSSGAGSTPTAGGAPAAGPAGPHIQLSTTAYSAGNLAGEARKLLDRPGQPIAALAAESPSIGPIGTPIGLESCLAAIGAVDGSGPAPEAVSADLATFDGRPAAVVVVTRAGASTAWAVERSCTTGAPKVLEKATPVP